jgi:hypothetical protein
LSQLIANRAGIVSLLFINREEIRGSFLHDIGSDNEKKLEKISSEGYIFPETLLKTLTLRKNKEEI